MAGPTAWHFSCVVITPALGLLAEPGVERMTRPAGELTFGLFWPTAVILIATFFTIQHDSLSGPQSVAEPPAMSAAKALHSPATFSIRTRFAFIGFSALGTALMLIPARRPLQKPSILLSLMAASAFLWGISLPWYESPVVSANRSLPWACFAFGLVGLARQFTVRELAKLTVVVTVAFLAIGVSAEILLGTFNPQRIGYQFAGMLTPDAQGIHCSLLVLSALAVLGHTSRNLPLHLGFIAIGVLFLFLAKSPITCWGFAIVVLMLSFLRPAKHFRGLNWFWFPGLAVAIVATLLLGTELQNGFTIAFEEVGPGGIVLCLLIAGAGARQAWLQFKRTGDHGYRFLIAQIVFGLVNCLANTQYTQPSLCVALCLASLTSLELTPTPMRSAVSGAPETKQQQGGARTLSQLSLSGS